MAINNPHDHFFRQMFGNREVLGDFFQRYLPPEVLSQFDLSTLELHRESYIDEDLREHQADLLCQVARKEGGSAYLYLLLEHKSAPDRWVTLQLLRYKLRAWEQMRAEGRELAPILPILVYHGVQPWRVPSALRDLLKTPETWLPYVADYQAILFDLSQYQERDLRGGAKLLIALLMLKHIFRADLESVLVRIVRLIWQEMDQQIAATQLQVIFRYAAAGANVGRETAQRVFEQAIEQGGESMATWVDEIYQEGFEQGIEQGIERGIERGVAQGVEQGVAQGVLRQLLRILRHRYAALPESLPDQLAGLTLAQKESLVDVALDAETLDAFLAEFQRIQAEG